MWIDGDSHLILHLPWDGNRNRWGRRELSASSTAGISGPNGRCLLAKDVGLEFREGSEVHSVFDVLGISSIFNCCFTVSQFEDDQL